MLPRPDQVRREGPPRRCADDLRAVAKGRAGHRFPDQSRAGDAGLAIGLTNPKRPSAAGWPHILGVTPAKAVFITAAARRFRDRTVIAITRKIPRSWRDES